ncbi:hypothetical protein XENOCAPTIV_008011, partial [Xenoophorus captivus]
VLMPELHRQKMMKRSRHPSSSDDSDNGRRKQKERKKGKKWTRVKAKQRGSVSVRDRTESRNKRRVWTFEDILAGQAVKLQSDLSESLLNKTLCVFFNLRR